MLIRSRVIFQALSVAALYVAFTGSAEGHANTLNISVLNGPSTGQQITGGNRTTFVKFVNINPLRFTKTVSASAVVAAAPTPSSSLGSLFLRPALTPDMSQFVTVTVPDDLSNAQNAVVTAQAAIDSIFVQSSQSSDDSMNSVLGTIDRDARLVAARAAFQKLIADNNQLQSLNDPALPDLLHARKLQSLNEAQSAKNAAAYAHQYHTATNPRVIQFTQPQKDAIAAQLAAFDADSKALIKKAAVAQSDIQLLLGAYPTLVAATTSLSDIESSNPVSCGGLLGGSSVTTITLTLTPVVRPTLQSVPPIAAAAVEPPQVSNGIVNCLGSIALSGGFIFSFVPQVTYTAQPRNASLPTPAPGASSVPDATIQQSAYSPVRTVPVAFVHFSPFDCGETCEFISFGTGINTNNSSQNGVTLDFALGGSVSVYRYAFVTVGGTLAQTQTLAKGYGEGQPIAVGGAIPTVISNKVGMFVSVTFGGAPGGKSPTNTAAK